MRRYTHREVPPSPQSKSSGVNPYPRALMICGAALIAYGVITPVGILLRNVVYGLPNTSATAVTNSATVGGDKVGEMALREKALRRASRAPASAVPASAARASAVPAGKTASIPFAVRKDQDEITKLYTEWKDAWRTRDIDAIMKLYSPRVRFRNVFSQWVDYEGARQMLLMIWGPTSYMVHDKVPATLSIKGKHAVLIAEQVYMRPGMNNGGLEYTHRYHLELENVGSRGVLKSSDVPSQKGAASRTAWQWRIVKSEFLRDADSGDAQGEIY